MKNIFYLFLLLPYLIQSQVTVSGQKATYRNPYPQPIKVEITQNPWDKMAKNQSINNQNIANNIRNAAANGAFKTASQKAVDLISLKNKNLNQYKYIIISQVTAKKESETKKMRNEIIDQLKKTNYIVLEGFNKIPKELQNNINMGLLLSVNCQNDGWPFKKVLLSLTDYDGNVIHQRGVRHDRSAHFLTKLTLSSIVAHPHNFRNQLASEKNNISREEAIEKLREAKELYDLGILNEAEYNVFSIKYKPIIMNIKN